MEFPGPDPGPARGQVSDGQLTLENEILACRWRVVQDRLRPEAVADKLSGQTLSLADVECFQIVLADSPRPVGRTVKASDLTLVGPPEVQALDPNERSPRLADRVGGRQIVARLADADSGLEVEWRAILRDGSNYVQFRLTLGAAKEPLEVKEVIFWDLAAANARVMGTVDGSPVVAGTMFFACEHPMAKSEMLGAPAADGATRFRCRMPCQVLVRPGEQVGYTSIVGLVPEGQLRRGFLYYLERERAHPYRPLLHYNNGSEIGCEYWRRRLHKQDQEAAEFRRKQEQVWLENIRAFGEQLVVKRGVTMDAFAHDFEWDDETLVWQFHEGYPQGFGPAQKAAEQFGARVGVWLSPAGGYPCKPARMERGRQEGFEINPNGLSLAGPRYYSRVRTVCANMVQRYGVNYFKFDGFGAGNNQPGPGPYGSDVEALLRSDDRAARVESGRLLQPFDGNLAVAVLAQVRGFDLAARKRHQRAGQRLGSAEVDHLPRQRDLSRRAGQVAAVPDQLPDDPRRVRQRAAAVRQPLRPGRSASDVRTGGDHRRDSLVLRDRDQSPGAVHRAAVDDRPDLGRAGRGRPLVAQQRGRAGGYALGGRRSGQERRCTAGPRGPSGKGS